MKNKLKYIIAVILIIIFTFSIVPKRFQNDTFYIIELGKGIMENGVDWEDHYSIHNNLEYRYPHWAFDVINANIYNMFGFDGVYVFAQIFASIFVLLVFWNMLRKEINFTLAFISTFIVSYMMKDSFCARGQIISYSIFLLEYILLENFVERPTFFKTLALLILSCIMANVHSTAWIMMFILILPFIGERVIYEYSLKGINERLIKRYNKKLKLALDKGESEDKIEKIENELKHQKEFKIKIENSNKERKIVINKKQRVNEIWVAILAIVIGALITPIKLTPFLYFLKTSAGNSLGYINEHLPIIIANSLEFFSYTAILVALLGFTKSKLRLSDALLIFGLYIMTISGRRNQYLLIGLTFHIIIKMIDDFIKDNRSNLRELSEKTKTICFTIICLISIGFSIYFNVKKWNDQYISEDFYPIKATEFIKNNLDYKDIRFYNRYEHGSYLLMKGIPVFIDSRCDLYTPEFNEGVTVFDDYMEIMYGKKSVSSLMDKYKLDYAIVPVDEIEYTYISEDNRYTELYKDKYFAVYKYDR